MASWAAAGSAVDEAKPAARKAAAQRKSAEKILNYASMALHGAAGTCFLYVWLWHMSPAAALLKGASEYGWFFRYLTFCSFTMQTIQLMSAIVADLRKGKNSDLCRLADDLSCLVFVTANTVTIMYYGLEALTNNLSEGTTVVVWVNFAVHSANCIVVWVDLLLCHPRSFSDRAQRWTVLFVALYCVWIVRIKTVRGAFPYPFLDELAKTIPFPYNFLMVASGGVCIIFTMFRLGRFLSGRITLTLGRAKDCDQMEVRGEIKVD